MNIIFDHFYAGYEEWFQTELGQLVDQIESQAIFSLLPELTGLSLLEIGCGTGHFSRKFEEKGAQVTGIDLSKQMLATAQKLTVHPQHYQLMDAHHLTFEDEQFDVVLSITAFEFISDIQQVYSEMKRVLKPNGTLLIATIQAGSAWAEFYHSEVCKGTAFDYAHFKQADDLINLDPKSVIAQKEALFFPPMLDRSEYHVSIELAYQSAGHKGGFLCLTFKK